MIPHKRSSLREKAVLIARTLCNERVPIDVTYGVRTVIEASIVIALESFAREAVKSEAVLCKWHSGYRRFCSTCVRECEEKARKEALEEAAKVAESKDIHGFDETESTKEAIAEKIRSLIAGKTGESQDARGQK